QFGSMVLNTPNIQIAPVPLHGLCTTEDERRIFRECNEERFWYRSVPISAVSMIVRSLPSLQVPIYIYACVCNFHSMHLKKWGFLPTKACAQINLLVFKVLLASSLFLWIQTNTATPLIHYSFPPQIPCPILNHMGIIDATFFCLNVSTKTTVSDHVLIK
uniref:OCIA domain-containing protein 1 n=1 Tax=Chelydra serpentina TaxID=8475 RepID=A0A8C3S6K3_CHESE